MSDITPPSRRVLRALHWSSLASPVSAFVLSAMTAAATVAVASHLLDPRPDWIAEALGVGLFISAMALTLSVFRATYPHDRLGACNVVTQIRAAMVAMLSVAVVVPGIMATSAVTIFAIAAVALALDGLDGALARRAGLGSAFGARFDMEVDAALAAMLALILIRSGLFDGVTTLVALIILGIARYGFVTAAVILPWLNRPLPDRLSRKVVCVVQIATLSGLLLPFAGGPLATAAVLIAAALLIWSFGRDIRWLARRRHDPL